MKTSRGVWLFRVPPLAMTVVVSIGVWLRTHSSYSFLLIAILAFWTAMLARRLTEESQWSIDARGVRGFGLPRGLTVDWNLLQVHVLPSRIRLVYDGRVTWIHAFVFQDSTSDWKARKLEELGAKISRSVVAYPTRLTFSANLAWVAINLWVLLTLLPAILAIMELVTGDTLLLPDGKKSLTLIFASFVVGTSGIFDDAIARVGLLAYWSVILAAMCFLSDPVRSRTAEVLVTQGVHYVPILFVGFAALLGWIVWRLSDLPGHR